MNLELESIDSIDLIVIKKMGAEVVFESENGIALYHPGMKCMFVHCPIREDWDVVLEKIQSYDLEMMVLHQTEYIQDLKGVQIDMVVNNLAYLQSSIEVGKCDYPIRFLEPKHAKMAGMLYHQNPEDHYVAYLIEKKKIIGAFDGEKLIGMIGTHDEGSVGLLSVDPSYRRKNLATALESTMIDIQIKNHHIPYCQVVLGNEASLALQNKLGLEKGNREIAWCTCKG